MENCFPINSGLSVNAGEREGKFNADVSFRLFVSLSSMKID